MKNLYIFIIIVHFISCNSSKKITTSQLNAKDFKNNIEQNVNKQIIDVRTPEEFSQGFIKYAININIYDSDFIKQINQLNKNLPTYIYCKAGARSADALKVMLENGFKEVYNLDGGLLAWNQNKFALTYPQLLPQSNLIGVAKTTNHHNNFYNITTKQFDSLAASSNITIIDFTAVWCGPCKRLSPILDELQKEYGSKIAIHKIDIDNNKEITSEFAIMSIPFVKMYKNGKLFEQFEGLPSKANLKYQIDKMLK